MLKSKKKIFILFSGELRFFEENIQSIKHALNGYEIIFLFYPWKREIEKVNLFKKFYENNNFDYIEEKSWNDYVKKIKFPDNANNIINLFYMWDALTQSFSKVLHKLDKNDLILRFRTDIKIHSKKFNLNFENIEDNTLYIPDRYHWNGFNDQVFLTRVKTLDNFNDFFEFVDNLIIANHFICPEYIFYKFIKKKNMKTIFFELDYQLLRDKKNIISNKKSHIPLKDKLIIKFLKIKYKFRNFRNFYINKEKRNNKQNLFYEK